MWAGVLAEDMNQTIWRESQCLTECGIGNGGDEHKTMDPVSLMPKSASASNAKHPKDHRRCHEKLDL